MTQVSIHLLAGDGPAVVVSLAGSTSRSILAP
jgi:hypothetical protein